MQDENIERKRVPKMDKRTRDRVEALALPTNGQKGLNAREIWGQLYDANCENDKEEEQYIIVTERSIQRFIEKCKAREPESLKFERQPWNMLVNEKAGIPFDPILPRLLRLWFSRHFDHEQEIPFVVFPVGIAKWAVRLHMVAPSLSEKELLYRARRYFAMERMAILDGKSPDSSYDDLEIAMKDPDTDPKVKADFDQFVGVKGLVLQDTEVSPDIVTKKIKTKQKRRNRK